MLLCIRQTHLSTLTAHAHTRTAMAEGGCCSHDHDCGDESCGTSSLHGYVNHPRVTALNALDDAAAPRVLRPWQGPPPLAPPIIVNPPSISQWVPTQLEPGRYCSPCVM